MQQVELVTGKVASSIPPRLKALHVPSNLVQYRATALRTYTVLYGTVFKQQRQSIIEGIIITITSHPSPPNVLFYPRAVSAVCLFRGEDHTIIYSTRRWP